MNLANVGQGVVGGLIGYAVPDPASCSGHCPTDASRRGPFRFELVLPHLDWKADKPIVHGIAILSFSGPAVTTISGSATNLISFAAKVGGTRTLDLMSTADCIAYQLDPATPINEGLSKLVTISVHDPNPGVLRSFIAGPDVRLPAGIWDITATTNVHEGSGCDGTEHSMQATLRISVTN